MAPQAGAKDVHLKALRTQNLSRQRRFWVLLTLVSLLASCTLRKTPEETSFPENAQDIEKSFFIGKEVDGQSKTFLCGWSAITQAEAPHTDHLLDIAQSAEECNIVFKIEDEKEMVAYMVQPSYINEPAKWPRLFTIPIKDHFYKEARKDDRGRETNEITKTKRSDWSARPLMTLDFGGLKFEGWAWDRYMESLGFSGVEDIEWDKEKGFLGFTIVATGKDIGGSEAPISAKVRFNFMQFRHNDGFQRLAYHEKNSRFMNVLFLNGKKIDGVEQVLYASRWNLDKSNIPIQVALNNFPKDYESVARDSLREWNVAFTKVLRPDIANPEQNPVV
jgi:hypothetical protein